MDAPLPLADITGLWAVTDKVRGTVFFRFRQADGSTFEGLQLGVGPISLGQVEPGGAVSWCIGEVTCTGCMDPSGWFIKGGRFLKDSEENGEFTAMRQQPAEPLENGDSPSNAPRSAEFQDWANGLFFSIDREGGEQLLDADGVQVMMEWEQPWMERCVDQLEITESCDVLEVGFGCGYSANRIQLANPRSHTIIECAGAVLERLRSWAKLRPNVRIIEGTWQSRLPELGMFDRIFFDDYGEPGRSDFEMRQNCPDSRYHKAYSRAQSHFHGFLNIALKWHSKEGTRISGYLISPISVRRRDVQLKFERMPVAPPEHCEYFYSKEAVVPLFVKTGVRVPEEALKAPRRTRSRSRSLRQVPQVA